jgi:RND family efflux transporter MFP subunit
MKTRIIITGVAVALVAGTTIKLFSNKSTVEANVYRINPEKRVLVQADTATLQLLDRTFTYTGTFVPFREVMIIPQVYGEVKGVYFNEGDVVSQGKRLVQVDDELLQAQYVSAEANYETAKRSLSRYESASLGGGVSQLQLDNYRLNFKNAESQLKQLSKQIRLSKIEAPFSGTITFKDVEFGSVAGKDPVARITDLSQLKLEVSVPEKEIGMFREGQSISITTDVYPGKTFKGQIEYVADRADGAHNYVVKVLVKNSHATALKAGMYGTAFLNTDLNKNSIVIPRSALLGSAKNPQVFVVDGSVARLKSIQTGAANGDSVEVTGGIASGEVVVIGGQINLTDGSKVEIAK